jgi:hypothetical protein
LNSDQKPQNSGPSQTHRRGRIGRSARRIDFDPAIFLGTAGAGKTSREYRSLEKVFFTG